MFNSDKDSFIYRGDNRSVNSGFTFQGKHEKFKFDTQINRNYDPGNRYEDDDRQVSGFIVQTLYFVFAIVYFEFIFHIICYNEITRTFLYNVVFSAAFSMIVSVLCSILKGKAARIVAIVIMSVITLFYEIQFVLYSINGRIFLFSTTGYDKSDSGVSTVMTVAGCVLMLVPIVLLVILLLTVMKMEERSVMLIILSIVICISFSVAGVSAVTQRSQTGSDITKIYKEFDTPKRAVKNLGVLTSVRLSIQK